MPSKPQPDRFLNFKEVAEMIGLAVKTVRNGECGTNEIPRIKLGARVVFSFNAVQAWMAAKARKAEEDQQRSRMAVYDILAPLSRRRRAVEDTLKTIINGGRYR
jgi:predicted DNA-binding transcriptional regulator AlpA